MSANARKGGRKLQAVHLGIDHGTTFTRARLLPKGKNSKPEVVSESVGARNEFDSKHRIRGSQTMPDFPAFCLPGKWGEEMPSSFEIQQSPNRVPLKLASLIFDDQNDIVTGKPRSTLLSLMPRQHENLITFKKGDADFDEKLKETWKAHFENIRDRVLSLCEECGYELASLTTTLPDWANDEKVDRIYDDIIHGVFGDHIPASQFFHVNEAQAMARCLIKEQLSRGNSQLAKLVGERSTLLVVDIGGTAMNACLVEVCRDEETILTTVELESFGCFGGSELWEMAIADALARQIPHAGDEVLSAYLSDFTDNKAVIQSPDDIIRLNYKGEVTELIQKDARLCFDQAFKKALDHLDNKLRHIFNRLAQASRLQDLAMVFTGGSFNTHCIYTHVSSLVRTLDPDGKSAPIFLNQLMHTHIPDPTGLIARGAVYAANTTKTVRHFMDGAAFGVQSCLTKDHLWVTDVPALVGNFAPDGLRGEYPGYKLRKREKLESIALKIVCDPLHGYDRFDDDTLSYLNCYDLYVVDEEETDTQGSYRWYLDSWASRGPIYGLTLIIEYVDGEWKDGTGQVGARKEWTIPLRYDIGTGCVLPDQPKVKETAWEVFYT
ncbi:hypothetical protein MAPG_01477 [Magnaporthiopsis poae ATCC 64411]|uniref:Hsp70-like protein n=1 Tax=Magnaporthiopsis poae (strain ATCC 64411 / 73-15) TaxID=644358 RepID=A0A0C4DNT2_MAGP6|nr:hypothetical protein MAPG_01477 [Magnaporthiopsis poae ATCC 64411]